MELTPFDQYVTDDFLQTLKLIIPYLPESLKKTAGVYVKLSELANTLHKPDFSSLSSSTGDFLKDIAPYFPNDFQQYADMINLMQNLDISDFMQSMNMDDLFQQERTDFNE